MHHTDPTAPHCNTLQFTATHCNTLQHTATQSSVCRLDSRADTIKRARFFPKIPVFSQTKPNFLLPKLYFLLKDTWILSTSLLIESKIYMYISIYTFWRIRIHCILCICIYLYIHICIYLYLHINRIQCILIRQNVYIDIYI